MGQEKLGALFAARPAEMSGALVRPRALPQDALVRPAAHPIESPGRGSRRLAGSIAWTFSSDVLARGASLWLSVYCARVLTAPHFGLFALTQSVAQFLWVFGDSVANNGYATREVARSRAPDASLPAALYTMRIAAAVGLIVLYVGVLAILPMEPEKRAALATGAVFILAYASFPDWLARGFQNFRALAAAQLAIALGLVGATWILLPHYPDPGVAAAIWGGAFLLGTSVLFPLLARDNAFSYRLLLSVPAWSTHLFRSSLCSLGALGAMGITHLPMILLGALAPPRELSMFAVSFRIVLACVGLGSVVWWPFFSALSSSSADSARFRSSFRAFLATMLGTSLPIALGLWLFADDLVPAIFGREYEAAAGLLRWLVWTLPLYFLVTVFEITLLAGGGEWQRARVNAAAVGVLLIVALALMPTMGARGAAIALLAALTAAATGYVVTLRHQLSGEAWSGVTRTTEPAPPERPGPTG